ncbi:MAG: LytTR family DNA-binding domain-containing protein [Bacteroidota bacterium]
MIKAILIEDESYIRKGLKILIDSIDKEIVIVGECGTVKEAVTVVNACEPDLVFMDINLPDGTAFDILEQLPSLLFKLIFVTAYDEFVLKALKAGALDYILKPVDPEELKEAIGKVKKATALTQPADILGAKNVFESQRLVISLQEGLQVINLNELKYCTSDKGYTTFYLSNGKSILVSKPLKHFETSLPEAQFVRVHQSSVVNLDYVDKYHKNGTIILKDGEQITVSNRKKESFISRLLNK